MGEDMISKISNEIEKTGFPLELRVAEFLTNRGYYVTHSLYYIDEEENKSREVDLRAWHNTVIKNIDRRSCFIRNCLLIECKKTTNKPWVFLSSSVSAFDPDIFNLPSIPNVNILSLIEWYKFARIHPFSMYDVFGRSYFQTFKNNESSEMIFKALTTAVKATLYCMKSGLGRMKDDLCYYYPMVILDGDIYQAVLINGQITVQQVNSVLVSFLYKSPIYEKSRGFAIPVINEEVLPVFIDRLEAANSFIANIVQQHIASEQVDWSQILKNGYPR